MSSSSFLVASAVGLLSIGGLLVIAERRWRSQTTTLIACLGDKLAPPRAFCFEELQGLPLPVQRYFRTVLCDGQLIPAYACFAQEGQFLLQPAPDGWRSFTATQHIACGTIAGEVGFVWDACIRATPGVPVWVRDAFVEGVGYMSASVFGLLPLVSFEGTPEIATGALYRYLAEAVWCPTALLPSQGVQWFPLTDTSARASLTIGAVSVSLEFHFGKDGLIQSVFTPSCPREEKGRFVPTPWQGRFADYQQRDGMRIPLRGEVEWLLPEGPQVYWRGTITAVAYNEEVSC
jgi:hypothetical protein